MFHKDTVSRNQALARAANALRHSMAAACLRHHNTGKMMESVSKMAIDADQGRMSGDVQTDCQFLTLPSSHCTAVQSSIIVVLTLFAT